jgi:lipid II:glycine glycyltransferase (peptidoglycan interpeptide bridge formation enzyme)
MKAKVRSQINKPQRDGLTAKLGQMELIHEFYMVFAENMRDLGSPVHSRHWIEAVVRAYGEQCRIAVVYTPQGEVAAAGIILLHPNLVVIPWASTRQRFNRMNPNMLLYWTFLSFACDHGYPQFDFGRSTPDEGTYRFKKQWGASPQPLYWYELPTQLGQGAEAQTESPSLRQRAINRGTSLVAKLWQKLPLPVANALGPKVRKYISL